MGILGWIVLGLVAGAVAKLLIPGKDVGGLIITMLLGIAGALLGGFLGSALFDTGLGSFFDLRTWIVAVIGAVILLLVYRLVTGRKTRRSRVR
ncbi:GlsB/YeaQ/YmgE family stress response membrane protein [Haloechinothrix halophila]|uniref:GlsB/YeaQ/YmgE family stress response membrane protein n=1 Tax=Haloechinothrix halophila TaxID=1069073 RepID=UPI00040CE040|nr:GlsB/YeaQ/YmgE family stress response membrane protein [Haloechinothrix halophila]